MEYVSLKGEISAYGKYSFYKKAWTNKDAHKIGHTVIWIICCWSPKNYIKIQVKSGSL